MEETEAPLPLWRLVCLAVAIISLRRLPSVLVLYKLDLLKPSVRSLKEAALMGYFGPVGVSAIFYMHVGLEFLSTEIVSTEGGERADAMKLYHVLHVSVWFIVISSIVSWPLEKVAEIDR